MSLQDFFPTVPPPTPEQCILEYPYPTLPYPLPKVDTLDVPYIKEIGIKASLDNLAKHFHCTDYKFNLIQFWFLDIITDCLWRCQDEFQFPVAYQKIIIEWILYIFELIKGSYKIYYTLLQRMKWMKFLFVSPIHLYNPFPIYKVTRKLELNSLVGALELRMDFN